MDDATDPSEAASSQPSPAGGLYVLKYVEVATGREIEFQPYQAKRFAVKPLDFTQLISAAGSDRPSFPVRISNARATSGETGLDNGVPLVINATIENNQPLIAYGLVDGGWLPMPWANKRIAMLDRNVVIKLEKLQAQSGTGNSELLAQWLGLDSETVSPLLFALEGGKRRPPTEFEIRAELSRAQRALGALLPGAKVQQMGPVQRRAIYRVVLEHVELRARATRLLMAAAPLVVDRVKSDKRLALEGQVLDIAAKERIRRGSLLVLALLSCIYDSNPPSSHRAATPGRAVLKPTRAYTQEAAYNALADLSFLELMFNSQALFPDLEPVLYTADAGLAAFWASLHPCQTDLAHLGNGKSRTTMTFNMTGGLYPDLTDDEVQQLSNRISGDF